MMRDSSDSICDPGDDEDAEADVGCHHGEEDVEFKPSSDGKSYSQSYPHCSEFSHVWIGVPRGMADEG